MSPVLPPRPDLEHLKHQAKVLLRDARAGLPAALDRMASSGRAPQALRLADAQHVLAREYGFASWTRLKTHVESLSANPRMAFLAALRARDATRLRYLLERHVELRQSIAAPWTELPFGAHPVHAAVHSGDRESIAVLLAFGADINARTDWWAGGFGVLHGVDAALAPFLIERGAHIDLHAAAHLDLLEDARAIVAAMPAAVHERGGDGQTPLHFARSTAMANLLLAHGANIDALDVDHESTPAQWMIRDRTELARYLVTRGARRDFLLDVALGDLDAVREHLDRMPELVRLTITPESLPMRSAHAGGHIYLWSLGRNKAPHEIAHGFGHTKVFELLMARSPAAVQLAAACRAADDTLVAGLLARHPALVHHMPADIRRRLVYAVQDEDTAAVSRMLDAGWPTDGRGQDEGTALHWAAFLGHSGITRELLRHGAAVDATEPTYGGTPLHWALYGSVHGWRAATGDFVGVVDALLTNGAEIPDSVENVSEPLRVYLASHKRAR